jgi:hypothetical protein
MGMELKGQIGQRHKHPVEDRSCKMLWEDMVGAAWSFDCFVYWWFMCIFLYFVSKFIFCFQASYLDRSSQLQVPFVQIKKLSFIVPASRPWRLTPLT